MEDLEVVAVAVVVVGFLIGEAAGEVVSPAVAVAEEGGEGDFLIDKMTG